MHKISLRENVCTKRVCDALLSLLSTLIDFGLLTNRTKTVKKGNKKDEDDHDEEIENKKKKESDVTSGILSIHNTFMDVVIRLLKLFGCPHSGCPSFYHDSQNHLPTGLSTVSPMEPLRLQAISLLSRLLWYDKDQFKRFISILVNTREIQFLLGFLHGYLGFCTEPSNPHSPLPCQPGTGGNMY